MSVAMATMLAMLIQTVTTQRVLIFVLASKDTLEMDSHVKVNKSSPRYLKQAALPRNNCPWKLALLLKTCCHAPLSYFYYHTFCIMLLDIDECSNGSHDCDVNANCTNTNGSHSCTCKEGYTGKGELCQGKIRLDLKKKQNNCSSLIIALLSDKLAEEFFFLYSVTHCKSIVFTDINECNDDICDANANCTNTNGSHNCICK